ncbi:uncharacterized protein LOC120848726 [Ixodes scapularis]|uniref:uncharacterized protein LOC120848726 n=1 Tax=Ixodes scapularis TaxID=6945 RepID=UPI001A9CFE0C|nr:uncharacterized protein LOC120848726 [Ixodes scapularis]
MNTLLMLMAVALCSAAKSTVPCQCPNIQDIILNDPDFEKFRDPFPFLTSRSRLYLVPLEDQFDGIECVTSELKEKHDGNRRVDRTVFWKESGSSKRKSKEVPMFMMDVPIGRSPRSNFTTFAFTNIGIVFETVYTDRRCLIFRTIDENDGKRTECFFWVKEWFLGSPLRDCRFIVNLFCEKGYGVKSPEKCE